MSWRYTRDKGGRTSAGGKGEAKATRGSKTKDGKRKGHGSLAGWVVRAPRPDTADKGTWRSGGSPAGTPGDVTTVVTERRSVGGGDHPTQTPRLETWGAGDVGPVQPGYESGDTDAMLIAFERDTHRALADWVGDRELWPGWFGQGLHAMPPGLRRYPAYEADRTRWVLQRPGGKERLGAMERRMQRHADSAGARKLARERPVITASDLIRDRAERWRLEAAEDGGRRRRTTLGPGGGNTLSIFAEKRSTPLLRPSAELDKEGPASGNVGEEWGGIGDVPQNGTVGRKRKPSRRTTARHKKRLRTCC